MTSSSRSFDDDAMSQTFLQELAVHVMRARVGAANDVVARSQAGPARPGRSGGDAKCFSSCTPLQWMMALTDPVEAGMVEIFVSALSLTISIPLET
jgi:hypothetical protein